MFTVKVLKDLGYIRIFIFFYTYSYPKLYRIRTKNHRMPADYESELVDCCTVHLQERARAG